MAARADDLAVRAGALLAGDHTLNRATRRRLRPVRPALVAAGKRLDLASRRAGEKMLRDPEKWQEDVWTYYDTVPEVKYIGRFYGNALSRIRLVPAWQVGNDDAPVPFDSVDELIEGGKLDADDAPPPGLADEARKLTERLASSSDGMAGLMRGFGENLGLVGDCYLMGRQAQPDDDVVGDEVWQVYSTSALSEDMTSGRVTVKERPTGNGTPLPEGSDPIIYRVWRRHARWPGLSDSNLRACLDEAEELLVWSGMLRAIARSGTSAGILKVPTELDLIDDTARALAPSLEDPDGPAVEDPADTTPDDLTDLERRLLAQFIDPAEDPGSGAAVAPALARGKAEFLKELAYLKVDRSIDDKVIERIEFLIRRMAHGADLPVEVLTGVADANHWTGWQIEDATYKAHVEPTAQIPAAALTACHLRTGLTDAGHDPDAVRRTVYVLDPSALVVRPNRAEDARQLWDRWALSDDELRDAHGWGGDGPSDDELLKRYALTRGIGGQDLTAQIMNQTVAEDDPLDLPSDVAAEAEGEGDTPAPADDTAPEDGGDPIPSTGPDGARTGLVAAGALPQLGAQLGAIERRLRERLQQAASDELENVLRRAGSRLRGALQGSPIRDEVNGQPSEVVGLIVGAERAAAVVDPAQLLQGAFEPLADRWSTWVDQAEAEAASAVNLATPDDATTVEVTEPADVERGWAALLAGLLVLAGDRLFAAAEADPGELDAHASVPAGIIRDALSIAGGAGTPSAPFGTAAQSGPGGLLHGPRWTRTLAQVGIYRDAWTWQAGFPTTPYEPHQRLSGTVFDTWDDPALSNGTTWPRTSHYYPGDHRGCQCDAIPTLVAIATRDRAGAA